MFNFILIFIIGSVVGILISAFVLCFPIYLKSQELFWLERLKTEHHLMQEPSCPLKHDNNAQDQSWELYRPIISKELWHSFSTLYITLGSVSIALFTLGYPNFRIEALAWVTFAWTLLALGAIDLKTSLLPDILTLPLMWLGIGIQLSPQFATIGLEESVLGIIFAYVPLWLFTKIYGLIRHQEGLGFGDIKLLAAIGAWIGPWLLPVILFLASVLALLYRFVIFLRYRKGSRHEPFPFGPWLVMASFITLTILKLR